MSSETYLMMICLHESDDSGNSFTNVTAPAVFVCVLHCCFSGLLSHCYRMHLDCKVLPIDQGRDAMAHCPGQIGCCTVCTCEQHTAETDKYKWQEVHVESSWWYDTAAVDCKVGNQEHIHPLGKLGKVLQATGLILTHLQTQHCILHNRHYGAWHVQDISRHKVLFILMFTISVFCGDGLSPRQHWPTR